MAKHAAPPGETPAQPLKLPGEFLLLLCAIIWGSGFVSQRAAMLHIQPFTFIGARYLLGALVLLPFLLPRRRQAAASSQHPVSPAGVAAWWRASLAGGALLFAASGFQQTGLVSTAAGKAGFITTLYIVLVPLFGLFFGRKVSKNVWLALGLAVGGLFLLTVTGDFSIAGSDLVILVGAVLWALHIMAVDHFGAGLDGLAFSFGQFLVAGVMGVVVALFSETVSMEGLTSALPPILYSGIVVSGVGFTLQVLGQKSVQASVAALILSLEAVFAVLTGMLLLNERMTPREELGAVIMLAAVLLAQWKRRVPGLK